MNHYFTSLSFSPWARLAATILLLATVPLLTTAVAQAGAAVMDPASIVYQGPPGETINASVRMSNVAQTDLHVRLYLSDWSFDPVGNFTLHDVGTFSRSASEWIILASDTAEIGPNRTVPLQYTVAVPPDAEPGTYWTVIFAEAEPPDPQPGQITASISVRVGHIVYVNVPGAESSGAITGMFGTPPTSQKGSYSVIAQYSNTGNAAQGVEGTFTLMNELGEAVIEVDIERSVVLPGVDRAYQVNVVGPLPAGNYTALVVLNYGDEEQDVAGTIDILLAEPLLEAGGGSDP